MTHDRATRRGMANLSALVVAAKHGMLPTDQAVVMHFREGEADPSASSLGRSDWERHREALIARGFKIRPIQEGGAFLPSPIAKEARHAFDLERTIEWTAATYPKFNFVPLELGDAKELAKCFGITVVESPTLASMSTLVRIFRDGAAYRDLIIIRAGLVAAHKTIKILYELCHRLRDVALLSKLSDDAGESIYNIDVADQFETADEAAKRFALVGVLPTPAVAWELRREILDGSLSQWMALRLVRAAVGRHVDLVHTRLANAGSPYDDANIDDEDLKHGWRQGLQKEPGVNYAETRRIGALIFAHMQQQKLRGWRGFNVAYRHVIGSLPQLAEVGNRLLAMVVRSTGTDLGGDKDPFEERFRGDALARTFGVLAYTEVQARAARGLRLDSPEARRSEVWAVLDAGTVICDCSEPFARFVGAKKATLVNTRLDALLAPAPKSVYRDVPEEAVSLASGSADAYTFCGLHFARNTLHSDAAPAHACFLGLSDGRALCVVRPAEVTVEALSDGPRDSAKLFDEALSAPAVAGLLRLHG